MVEVDEYFKYQTDYEKQYGPNTLFLMQVGSFFEAYQTMDEGHDLSKIGSMLNIVVSKRNKSVVTVDRKNPYMAGFPVHATSKFLRVLMENGYTVVLCEQITSPPKPKREITGVYSPATYLNDNTTPDNMYILSIYVEENANHKTKDRLLSVGLALLDLSTGRSIVHEVHSTLDDDKIALDEASKFINSYNAKEVILTTNNITLITNDNLNKYLEIGNKIHHQKTLDELKKQPGNKLITSIAYQQEMLSKVYGQSKISPIEDLDLEHMEYGRNAFIVLLKYAIDHNPSIVNKLDKPELYEQNKYLHIGNNATSQLNVFADGTQHVSSSIKSLFDVINRTSTPMGRRFLKNALVQPLVSPHVLNQRYRFIDDLMRDKKWETVENILKEIGDIERWERKMKIGSLHPMEMYQWIVSHKQATKMFRLFDSFFEYDLRQLELDQTDMLAHVEATLAVDELQKYIITDITGNIFKEGVHPEVDAIQDEIDICNNFMESLASVLDGYIDDGPKKDARVIRVESNERDGHFLTLTKRRCDMLEKQLKNLVEIEVPVGKTKHSLKVSKLEIKHAIGKAGNTKISLPELQKNSDKVVVLTHKLKTKVKQLYEKHIIELSSVFRQTMSDITNMVTLLDFLKGGARTAHENRYTRPVIMDSSKSFVQVEQLRHPIVEKINTETEYVPVDIHLGVQGSNQDGILLFGLNSAGKSTLQKAIGIAVVMAQIGYFVAARKLTFCPYHSLFTRISGNDNIFKGLSSFELELVELGAILKRSGENTLVLADEIAKGTEHQSGLVIVMAMIEKLSESQTSFITATHLHELCDMDTWQNIHNVKKYHLHVEFDEKTQSLVYDRTLKEGNGSSFYGLQVAKYLMNDKDFIEKTIRISNSVGTYTFVSDKKSRYNGAVLMTKCQVCGHKPKKGQVPLETHHIEFQKNADQDGFLLNKPHKHKNHKSNLVVLCSECHDKIDTGELVIKGYKETSKGMKLEL
jgi:DNA mismatch repair protein MutS